LTEGGKGSKALVFAKRKKVGGKTGRERGRRRHNPSSKKE